MSIRQHYKMADNSKHVTWRTRRETGLVLHVSELVTNTRLRSDWAFFTPFKGDFKGQFYHAQTPPASRIDNSAICTQFTDFISDTTAQLVASGVLAIWGEVGVVPPPHLVLPITVEPSEPRLCHDERFLNLWIRDLPFKLDHLSDLPRYVSPGHFQTAIDDNSGYQHVRLHLSSETYFGLEWENMFFVFRTLLFGWKASALIYHNFGLPFHMLPALLESPYRNVSTIVMGVWWVSRYTLFKSKKHAIPNNTQLVSMEGLYVQT